MKEQLARCSRLRGVAGLPHRIIHEFAWFVNEWLWPASVDEEDSPEHAKAEVEMCRLVRDIRKEQPFGVAVGTAEQVLDWRADMFLKYCERKYHPMTAADLKEDLEAAERYLRHELKRGRADEEDKDDERENKG